jgi:hypothetical protein
MQRLPSCFSAALNALCCAVLCPVCLLVGVQVQDDQGPWPLNETTTLYAPMWLLAGDSGTVESLRPAATLLVQHPLRPLAAGPFVDGGAEWRSAYTGGWSPLSSDLPPAVHLLSWELVDGGEGSADPSAALLRLEHVYERAGPTPPAPADLSGPAAVDLDALFAVAPLRLADVNEKSLTLWLDIDNADGDAHAGGDGRGAVRVDPITGHRVVTITSKDIRTFEVTFA